MKRVLLLTGAMLLVAQSALAAQESVRFALHRKDKFSATKTIPNLCDNPGTAFVEPNYSPNADGVPCTQFTLNGPVLAGSTVYVVLGYPDGPVSGTSFGVDYSGSAGVGIDPTFTTWTSCADGLAFPNDGGNGEFPKPKGGVRITWVLPTSCGGETVSGVFQAVVGGFYVYAYSADVLRLTENLNLESGPELAVADCAGATTLMEEIYPPSLIDDLLGRVQFGAGTEGYTPCGVVPVHPSTWGKLKNQYTH